MRSKSWTLILAISLIVILTGKAQTISRSTLGMAGSSKTIKTNENSYFVSQSIGQASVIGTFKSNGKVLRQGFQQPPGRIHIRKTKSNLLKAVIYPNPTDHFLNIKLSDQSLTNFNVQLMDYMGRMLFEERYEVQPITVDLSMFSSGVYLLRISSRDKYLFKSVIRQ